MASPPPGMLSEMRKPERIAKRKSIRKSLQRGRSTWHEQYDHDRTKALYGDMVNLAVGCIVNVIYGLEFSRMPSDHPRHHIAQKAFAASLAPLVFYVPAVLTKNLWLSRLGMGSVVLGLSYMCLVEWPYEGECAIQEMMMGQVLMAVLTNVSLSFREKMIRLAYIFVVGSMVSLQSPNSNYWDEVLLLLGSYVGVATFGLWVYHFEVNRQLATIQGSRLVLVGLAVGFALRFWSSFSLYENLSSAAVPVAIACLCASASGSFQQEVEHASNLEKLVEDRTREIRYQTRQLRMVSMALQASETAIAITDAGGKIVWTNHAFESLCRGKATEEDSDTAETVLHGTSLRETIYDLDKTRKENRYILFNVFEDASTKTENEMRINDSIFRLEATPFAENPDGDTDSDSESDSESAEDNHSIVNDRFLVVFKDITSSRARESAEKEAHEKAMTAKAMGDAMVTLTHELRTPLQGIMGVTSLLLGRKTSTAARQLLPSSSYNKASNNNNTAEDEDDDKESLKLIMASSGLLLNLINNLLDIKKVSAKMMQDFHMAPIVASGPIRDAVGFCQPLASISNVKVVVAQEGFEAKHAVVKSNAIRLQQILINLVSNAIKYTRLGSEIRISAEVSTLGEAEQLASNALASSNACSSSSSSTTPVLVFSVSDCGPGIPPSQADRLFGRYSQLDDAKPQRILGTNKVGQPSGTGLGLNLCQEFVERMNGRIWAANNNNNNSSVDSGSTGSSFSFYLPMTEKEEPAPPELQPEPAMARRRASVKRLSLPRIDLAAVDLEDMLSMLEEPRVLLVDDTLINRKVFQRMLREIGIEDPVTVESGEKALEELARNDYDLVITDLNMPGMMGTELSRRINDSYDSDNEDDELPPVVIGLTADSVAGEVSERCAASGMADVLSKPITLKELTDYFEKTLPKLEPGVWHKNPRLGAAAAAARNNTPAQ